MFYEQRMQVDGLSPAELRAEYDADLVAAVESVGIDAAAERTGVDDDLLSALRDGDVPELTLQEAARIQTLSEDAPDDAETIVELACEHLLLGMSTGVMDVEAVAGDIAIDLDPKEIQQKIERRADMTFEEFVHIQHVIASRQR